MNPTRKHLLMAGDLLMRADGYLSVSACNWGACSILLDCAAELYWEAGIAIPEKEGSLMGYIVEWYRGKWFRCGYASEWLARRAARRAWFNGGEHVSIVKMDGGAL